MTENPRSTEELSHQGFAAEQVPESAQGSGWRIFLIVAGSLCGLPVFVLSTRVFGSLGFVRGVEAALIGAAISATLAFCTAYTGSRTRMGLALLADRTFGSVGGRVVKLVIALSLIGWFAVNIGVLGATAASALSRMTDIAVPPLAIALPAAALIAAMTLRGATGLERLGAVLVPVTLVLLIVSVVMVMPRWGSVAAAAGSESLPFGAAVSAIVGSYIVGIVIQPDYGRFVRRPGHAGLGAAVALGVGYPIVLISASLASVAIGAPELITAMIILGLGAPALVVLLIGAWIDSAACLYSASLSMVSQFPRWRIAWVVCAISLLGAMLVILGAEQAFIPFLLALGVSLPPLAAIFILSMGRSDLTRTAGSPATRALAIAPTLAWLIGTIVGALALKGIVVVTHLPALDSILAAAGTLLVAQAVMRRTHRTAAKAPATT